MFYNKFNVGILMLSSVLNVFLIKISFILINCIFETAFVENRQKLFQVRV